MTPLVSAIMPTRNRRDFLPAAIAGFLAQDWPNKELVIIADGEPIGDLIPADPRIRLYELGGNIGTKRNLACERASGEYIVHFDDDDHYGPTRISEQVRILRQSSRPATGCNVLPFAWDEGRRAWLYLGRQNYAIGTSLCYLRSYWKGHRFKAEHIGEDNEFVRGLGERIISHNLRSIVARMHGGSTCQRIAMLTGTAWTGAPGQAWQEIQYEQLGAYGYPIPPAAVSARAEESTHDSGGDCGDHSRIQIDLAGATRNRDSVRPHRARRRARG